MVNSKLVRFKEAVSKSKLTEGQAEELANEISESLAKKYNRELLFKKVDKMLENSKITDELALKWGSELKERAAKRHGLIS